MKPLICMNLTQEEWGMLNNIYEESYEAANDLYSDDPIANDQYIIMSTKPSWA